MLAELLSKLNLKRTESTVYNARSKDPMGRIRAIFVKGLEQQVKMMDGKAQGRSTFREHDEGVSLGLRYGNRPFEIGPTRLNSLHADSRDALKEQVKLLIQAVQTGELDSDLKKAAVLGKRGAKPAPEASPAAPSEAPKRTSRKKQGEPAEA